MSSTHSKRIDKIDSFKDVVRVIGRGATLGRSLTLAEAEQAAHWLLNEVQLMLRFSDDVALTWRNTRRSGRTSPRT